MSVTWDECACGGGEGRGKMGVRFVDVGIYWARV